MAHGGWDHVKKRDLDSEMRSRETQPGWLGVGRAIESGEKGGMEKAMGEEHIDRV